MFGLGLVSRLMDVAASSWRAKTAPAAWVPAKPPAPEAGSHRPRGYNPLPRSASLARDRAILSGSVAHQGRIGKRKIRYWRDTGVLDQIGMGRRILKMQKVAA